MNVRSLLLPERLSISAVLLLQLLATAAEAGFLLLVTRTGLALSLGDERIGIIGDTTVSVATALTGAGAFVLIRFLFGITAAVTMSRTLGRIALRVREIMIEGWLGASWPVKQRIAHGRVHQLLCNYTQTAATIVNSGTRFLSGAASLCVLFATAFVVQPRMTGFATIIVLLLGLLMRPLRNRVKRAVGGASEGLLAYSAVVAEAEAMALEIEVLGVRAETSRWVTSSAREAVRGVQKSFFAQAAISPSYQFGAYSVIVGLLFVGSQFGVDDVGTIGAVLLLMLRSLSYGQSMQTQRAGFLSARVFLDQLEDELEIWKSEPSSTGTDKAVVGGGIEATGLTFSYDGESRALDAIDFDIRTGEIIGVVGPSGSGKSTLAELILGLRSSSGQLRVDGVLVDEADRQWWSQHVSLVPQNHELLTGTVADNVRFLRPAITDEEVEQACQAAGIHDEVMRLPEGYDSHLGERGSSLSGGQRQRLCIARALVGKPHLLVMDEPTSALDAASEAQVLRSIHALRESTTVIIVTHRPACLDICDRVLALNNGQLEHFGLVADLRVEAVSGTADENASLHHVQI